MRGRAILDLAGGCGLCSIAVTVFFSCTLVFTAVHWVATLNVGSGGAHASYYHRANEQVSLLTPSPTPNKSLQTLTGPAGLLFFLPTLCIHFMHAFILSGLLSSSLRQIRLPSLPHRSQVQVGVEFEANTRLQDTTFSFGYHLTLPQANMVFRGLVDTNWCVGAVLEKKMPPLPVTLALGAFLNHWRNRFHCGFSITVG